MSAASNGPRRQLSLTQASERLRDVVDDAAQHGPIELTEGGQPVAVIVSLDEYRRLAGDRPT